MCKYWYEDSDRTGDYGACKAVGCKVICEAVKEDCEHPSKYESV